jgi:hypothetical protein
VLLRREGWIVNHKLMYRLYIEEGLILRRKGPRRRKSCAVRMERVAALRANDSWSMDFSRPGKPTDNAFIESFNGKFRLECLNQHWFLSLPEAQAEVDSWREDYNGCRPHSALEGRTPNEFPALSPISDIPCGSKLGARSIRGKIYPNYGRVSRGQVTSSSLVASMRLASRARN